MEKLAGWFLHVQLHAYTLLGPSRYAVWLRLAKTQKHTKTWALHGTTWHYMALHGTTWHYQPPRSAKIAPSNRPAAELCLASASDFSSRGDSASECLAEIQGMQWKGQQIAKV